MSEFLRMIHAMLDSRYGTTPKKVADDWGIDFHDMSDEELDELEDAGIITWVSNESPDSLESLESTLGGVGVLVRGNVSDGPSEMLKCAPRDDGNYDITHATTEGSYAAFDTGKGVERSIYKVGDKVVTQNPYTHEFVYEDYDGTPLYFTVQSIGWDGDDGTFRYLIGDSEEWVSEEWLDTPMVSMMTKVFVPVTEDGPTKLVAKRTKLQVELDDMLDELSVDTYLDMMSSELPGVKEHAIEMLYKITEQHGNKTGEAQV